MFSAPDHTVNSIQNLWHKRLGHPSDKRLGILKHKHDLIALRDMYCDVCHMAKQKKLSFSNSDSHGNKTFDLIHNDIWGASPTPSLHGHRHFLTIADDCNRFTLVYLMKNKSETRGHIIHFVSYVETQFEAKVKVIRRDNRHEINMVSFFNSNGLIHQTTCVETLEQNEIAERKHQHVLNVTRNLIFLSKLSNQFWSYAILHAVLYYCC